MPPSRRHPSSRRGRYPELVEGTTDSIATADAPSMTLCGQWPAPRRRGFTSSGRVQCSAVDKTGGRGAISSAWRGAGGRPPSAADPATRCAELRCAGCLGARPRRELPVHRLLWVSRLKPGYRSAPPRRPAARAPARSHGAPSSVGAIPAADTTRTPDAQPALEGEGAGTGAPRAPWSEGPRSGVIQGWRARPASPATAKVSRRTVRLRTRALSLPAGYCPAG